MQFLRVTLNQLNISYFLSTVYAVGQKCIQSVLNNCMVVIDFSRAVNKMQLIMLGTDRHNKKPEEQTAGSCNLSSFNAK